MSDQNTEDSLYCLEISPRCFPNENSILA